MSQGRPAGVQAAVCEAPRAGCDQQVIEHQIAPRLRDGISAAAVNLAQGLDIETAPHRMADLGALLLRERLPPEAIEALEALDRPSMVTAVILRGLAELPAPATPVAGFADDRLLAPQDMILTGAMRIAGGAPVAFAFENQGRIVRNVVANPDQRGVSSSHGYDVDLFFHQDNCGQPFEGEDLRSPLPPMPKHLGFLALRNTEQVPLKVALLDDVLEDLPPGTCSMLASPAFHIGAPQSVAADGFGTEAIEGAPVLIYRGGYWESRYDPFLVTPRSPAAAAANARLILTLADHARRATDILLSAGDLLIFKNTRLFHMRSAFTPGPREESRWLRRIYGAVHHRSGSGPA
jgi:hypothetical protein